MKDWRASIAVTLLAATLGCTASTAFREAKDAEQAGQWDLAVQKLARALELNPDNPQYKLSLHKAKLRASQAHFEKGKLYRSSGNPEFAAIELEQAVLLDPTNDYAAVELRKAHEDYAKMEAERNGETRMEKLKKKARGSRAVTPMLEPASDKPINLNFPQPKPIKQIYRALADAAGINIIFDPQLKDDNVSIVLNGLEFQKALETLIRQENHFYKIIDERTVLIAADTPQNRKTYEDLVIRTFYLSNADVTEVANALRALLQTTRISVNKAENSITLRDTSDKVAVAERIVEQNDKQVSEVVVDVELLQVNATKAEQLGPLLSSYSLSASVPSPANATTNLGAAVGAGQFTWDQLKQLSINSFGFAIPSVTYFFVKNNTNAELLAKPQLRVAEGQKAQLLIGDKVPIPVTSFNTSNTTTGGSIVPITSFQYQDIGIKIEVEPRVHHNKEITLKLMVEVSQLNGNAPGTTQPIIGTRTISSNIRLKDGETNLLAGLFRRDKSVSRDQIPFLSDIPIIGRILSHDTTGQQTTDLVLTMTPHIIRIPDVTAEDLEPVYVGTDANISYQGSPRVENPNRDAGPFDQTRQPPAARPTPPPIGAPPAINLAPAAPPTDIFRPTPPPPPSPQQVVPPQGKAEKDAAAADAIATAAAATEAAAPSSAILLDFDPAYLALAVGQQQTILVRATSAGSFPGGQLTVRFDPSIATAVVARPILAGNGAGDAQIGSGAVTFDLPSSGDLSGTRVVGEITVRGIAPGRSTWSFLPNDALGSAVTLSQSVVEVR